MIRKLLAISLCALLAAVPVAAGAVVFFEPLGTVPTPLRTLRVAPLAALADDGVPRQFIVYAAGEDAWGRPTVARHEPIGIVFMRRLPGSDRVQALSAVCPHLGCPLIYKPGLKQFRDPCCSCAFEVDGRRVIPSVAPRDMDELDCEVRTVGNEQSIFVKFANFLTGIAEKKAKA